MGYSFLLQRRNYEMNHLNKMSENSWLVLDGQRSQPANTQNEEINCLYQEADERASEVPEEPSREDCCAAEVILDGKYPGKPPAAKKRNTSTGSIGKIGI
jgi:hypothetical protein